MLSEVEGMPMLGIRDAKYKVNHLRISALGLDNSIWWFRVY
jgi:hypothetical protein